MRPTTASLLLQPRQAGGARLPVHQQARRPHRTAAGQALRLAAARRRACAGHASRVSP
jgi:hypothetical protein